MSYQSWYKMGLALVCTVFMPLQLVMASLIKPLGVQIGGEVPLRYGSAVISGFTVPNSLVTFMWHGVIVGTTSSDEHGLFSKEITGLPQNINDIFISVTDQNGWNSGQTVVSPLVASDQVTKQDAILLSPTISVPVPSKRFLPYVIEGHAVPNSTVALLYGSQILNTAISVDANGHWVYEGAPVPTRFEPDLLKAVSRTIDGSESAQSLYLPPVFPNADINLDGKVDMTDLSKLMHFYHASLEPTNGLDVNGGGIINYDDITTMFDQWTGV